MYQCRLRAAALPLAETITCFFLFFCFARRGGEDLTRWPVHIGLDPLHALGPDLMARLALRWLVLCNGLCVLIIYKLLLNHMLIQGQSVPWVVHLDPVILQGEFCNQCELIAQDRVLLCTEVLRGTTDYCCGHVFEILKGYHHSSDVVEGALKGRKLQDPINCLSTALVERVGVLGGPGIPHGLLVIKLFEDPIAGKDYEVIVVPNFEALDVRSGHHDPRVSPVLGILGFDVADGARHREPPGEDSVRSHDQVHCAFPIRGDIRYVVAILIYPTSVFFNSSSFIWGLGFVIPR